MSKSILNGKKILAVDDEADVLAVLQDEILDACPDCTLDTATDYERAVELLESKHYDAVILDIMGVRGFELLDLAVKKDRKVAMLTAHALNAESLKKSIEMKARAYLPKDKLGEVVPFLEDMLKDDYESGWKKLFHKLHGFFTEKFEPGWDEKEDAPWKDWINRSGLTGM